MAEPTHNQHATADVGAQRVARVYAEALLDAAEKKGQAEAILELKLRQGQGRAWTSVLRGVC